MASVYSGYYTTGTYTKTRVRVDYSGTSATAYLLYTRTNTYSGQTGQTNGTFTFGGQSVTYTKYFAGQQTDAVVTSVNFTISTSGGTYSGSSTGTSPNYFEFSGSVTIPSQATAPTGLAMSNLSRGVDSFTATVSVTGWGGAGDSSTRYRELEVWTKSDSGLVTPYRYKPVWGDTLSSSITVDNNSGYPASNPLTIIPNKTYTIGVYASNGTYSTGGQRQGNYSTKAPAPTVSKTSVTTNSGTFSYSIPNQGGQYNIALQYSLNSGSTWTTAATITGSGAKTGSFTVSGLSAYTTYSMQTRTSTDAGQTSGSTVSFTTNGVAPTTPTTSVTNASASSNTVTYGTTSFGSPASGTVYLYGGTAASPTTQLTTKTTTGNSNYTHSSLSSNTKYYYRSRVKNAYAWSSYSSDASVITRPAAPSACTLTVTGTTTATLTITSPTQGNAATMTAYYKLNSGSYVNAGTITSGGTVTVNLTGLTTGTAYTATAKITNSTGDSGTLASSSVTTYKAPNTPTVTNFVPLVNGGKATVSTSSYGVPASANGRYIELEIGPAGGGTPYRYFTVGNTTSQNNITVNNSSAIYPSGGSLTIAANTKYAYRGYANNTVLHSTNSWVDFITLPAAPTATSSAINSVSGSLTITAPSQGTAATLTAYYKVGSGNYISAGTITPGASNTVTVTGLNPSTAYTITVKLTNSSGDSATTTTTFTTLNPLYCSVSGKAKVVRKLYCSVNGQTKEIKKLYGSVNGKTKRIW